MFIDEQAHLFSSSLIYPLTPLAVTLVLTGALVLTGCDSNDVTEPEIARVEISPDSASLQVGERVDFSVVALTASGGRVRDADLDLRWASTDPTVFTVEDGGIATGEEPGEAFCTVAVTNRRFVGRDSAFVGVF